MYIYSVCESEWVNLGKKKIKKKQQWQHVETVKSKKEQDCEVKEGGRQGRAWQREMKKHNGRHGNITTQRETSIRKNGLI